MAASINDSERVVVNLTYDENQLEQVLRGFDEPITVTCKIGDQQYHVNANLCAAPATTEEEEKDRAFYYLNGLLRVLVFLRLRMKDIRAVTIETDIKYLFMNASAKRIAQWKKRGFTTKQRVPIKHRALWEEMWNMMRFIDVQVVEKK